MSPRKVLALQIPDSPLQRFASACLRKNSGTIRSHVFLFIRHFLKNPIMQGSLVPSSPYLVNGMLRQVNWEKARLLVEFGPGIGTLTHEILRRMHRDAVLLTVELNEEFVDLLKNEIQDPRLRVMHGSAAGICKMLADLNFSGADYIISSLPYTNMEDSVRQEIMQESRKALFPNGTLLFYQYSRTVLPYLRASFSSVEQKFELLNIPPALIFNCTP